MTMMMTLMMTMMMMMNVKVNVPQGQAMTEDFKFPFVLILQSSWDKH